jgi:hypothetical protein
MILPPSPILRVGSPGGKSAGLVSPQIDYEEMLGAVWGAECAIARAGEGLQAAARIEE